jgi:restriction system protein
VRELHGSTMWMIRSPRGRYVRELLAKGIVGMGWGNAVARLNGAETPEHFYDAVKECGPHLRQRQVVSIGRQLYKFFREIEVGDPVMTYEFGRRIYHVGIVTGDAQTDPNAVQHIANFRPVEWRHRVERDKLSRDARTSLQSWSTLFQPSRQAVHEIERLIRLAPTPDAVQPASDAGAPDAVQCANGAGVPDAVQRANDAGAPDVVQRVSGAPQLWGRAPEPPVNANEFFVDVPASARAMIKDRLMQLTWLEMQALVAGLLRAMGYKTKISPQGSDRGKDIIASPDGLGLEQPRIFVEVKHHRRQIGAPEIRKFTGGRRSRNDRCLLMGTGGFTLEAEYEADRAKVPLTLIDGDDLVDLLLEHYERTDAETRVLFPLQRVYWPIDQGAGHAR